MSHATTSISTRLAARIEREARVLGRQVRRAHDGDVEGVHQVRVASRRLREMIAIARLVAPDAARAAARFVRRVGRHYGPVREIDVSRAIWDARARAGGWPAVVVAALERQAATEREQHVRAIARAGTSRGRSDVRARLSDLVTAVSDAADDRVLRRALASSVGRRARVVVAAIERAGTVYAAAPLHDIRIAAKKFRYAVELARDLAGARVDAAVRALKAEQDLLGDLHDLQVVQGRLDALAGGDDLGRDALRALKAATTAIEGECRALHARFIGGVTPFTDAVGRARALSAVALAQPVPHRMGASRGPTARGATRRAARGQP